MKYRTGDRVRIVSDRTKNMNSNGNMDKYLGTVMTIKEAHETFAYKDKRYRLGIIEVEE